MGYQNIGPNYWKGEEGRLALIAGEQKLTDEPGSRPSRTLARWADYLGDGFQAQTYPDSQNLFTLGRAAIYPAGSWEISLFKRRPSSRWGPSRRPSATAGDTCYISDHTDIAIGHERRHAQPEAARTFLVGASEEFADALRQRPAGLLLAVEPRSRWRPAGAGVRVLARECEPTIRSTYQILSRGTPNLENETWNASANVINGVETPEDAAPGCRRASPLVRAAAVS
jgi:raffinose/stachyose/melibiose transport system substrate-binding protein